MRSRSQRDRRSSRGHHEERADSATTRTADGRWLETASRSGSKSTTSDEQLGKASPYGICDVGLKYVLRRQREQVARDLKPIYTAVDADQAQAELEAFDEKWGSGSGS